VLFFVLGVFVFGVERIDLPLGMVDGCEPMHVQGFFAEASIERLDRGIVWFASAAEDEDNAVGVRSEIQRRTDEPGSVVAVNRRPRSTRRCSSAATTSRPLRPCRTSIARHSRVNRPYSQCSKASTVP